MYMYFKGIHVESIAQIYTIYYNKLSSEYRCDNTNSNGIINEIYILPKFYILRCTCGNLNHAVWQSHIRDRRFFSRFPVFSNFRKKKKQKMRKNRPCSIRFVSYLSLSFYLSSFISIYADTVVPAQWSVCNQRRVIVTRNVHICIHTNSLSPPSFFYHFLPFAFLVNPLHPLLHPLPR